MKKFMNIAAIATILLAFAACEKDSTESVNNIDQFEKSCKKTKTKKLRIHESSGVFEYGYNADCGPTYTQSSLIGSGTANLLGNFDTEASFCVDENGVASGPINGTITAANGDVITFYMADPSVSQYFDEEGMIHLEYTITGGTGRFENATGYFNLVGYIDLVNLTWDVTGEGSITY